MHRCQSKCVTEEKTKVATSSGSESLSAADGCDWLTEVSDVRRCQSMECLVRQQTQLELDALRDGKHAEVVSQQVLDVVVLAPNK